MKSFGTTLREARESKGLTTSQVAHDTHMLVQIVEDMEREDFHRIPAPIYGRGFVRLFAERVGLDPAPLINEFMEIFNGRKTPLPATETAPQPPPPPPPQPTADEERPVPQQPVEVQPVVTSAPIAPPPAPETAAQPQTSAPVVDVPPSVRGLDLFDPEAADSHHPITPPPPAHPHEGKWESPFASAYSEYVAPPNQGNAAQRFRDSLSVVSHGVLGSVRHIPRNAWRIAVLSLGAIVVILLIVWGCNALYNATSTPSTDVKAVSDQPKDEKAQQPAKSDVKDKPDQQGGPSAPAAGTLKSTGPKIEPLYID